MSFNQLRNKLVHARISPEEEKLLRVRIFTFPLIAMSSFLNYKLFEVNFGISGLSVFAGLWTSIGLFLGLEFSFGIRISNALHLEARFAEVFALVRRNLELLAIIGFGTIIAIYPLSKFIFTNKEVYAALNLDPGLIWCTFALCAIFGLMNQMLIRLFNGLSQYRLVQIGLALAALLSTILTFIGVNLKANFYLLFFLSSSNFLTTIPILLLISGQMRMKIQSAIRESKRFSVVRKFPKPNEYFLVACLSIAVTMIPRIGGLASPKFEESVNYSFALIVVTSIFSVTSVTGQVIWDKTLKTTGDLVRIQSKRFLAITLQNLSLFPIFVILWYATGIQLIPNFEMKTSIQLMLASYFLLVILNYHLYGSNYLNSGSGLRFQMGFMGIQVFLSLFLYSQNFFEESALRTILFQATTLLGLGLLPNMLRIRKLETN